MRNGGAGEDEEQDEARGAGERGGGGGRGHPRKWECRPAVTPPRLPAQAGHDDPALRVGISTGIRRLVDPGRSAAWLPFSRACGGIFTSYVPSRPLGPFRRSIPCGSAVMARAGDGGNGGSVDPPTCWRTSKTAMPKIASQVGFLRALDFEACSGQPAIGP